MTICTKDQPIIRPKDDPAKLETFRYIARKLKFPS